MQEIADAPLLPFRTNLIDVGCCIYCGSIDNLTDEHIIPFGLNGTAILPKSSCDVCSKITSNFEGYFQRKVVGDYRIKKKFRTRRKKSRPNSLIEKHISSEGALELTEVSIEDHPTVLTLPMIERARMYGGVPEFSDSKCTIVPWVSGAGPKDIAARVKARGSKGMTFGNYYVDNLFRMLAKIAHSFAVAEFGLGGFTPYLNKIILEGGNNCGHYIGGSLEPPPAAEPVLHAVSWCFINIFGKSHIAVYIRLFADQGAPIYHIFVGSPSQKSLEQKKAISIFETRI